MVQSEDITICPGCGLSLPKQSLSQVKGFNASRECWSLYLELSYYTLSLQNKDFPHQYIVDAYAAQHSDKTSPAITTAFALIGLCLACEWNHTGRQVQLAHMALARRSKSWPRFEPPDKKSVLTAVDVLSAPPGEKRDAKIKEWVRSVWEIWTKDHERVTWLIKKYFDPSQSFRKRSELR
jgi:hypothetical protein